MEITVTARGEGGYALDNVTSRVRLAVGEAFRVPRGAGMVHIVSGQAWASHGRHDCVLDAGETVEVPARSLWRRWRERLSGGGTEAVVVSPLNGSPLVIEFSGAEAICTKGRQSARGMQGKRAGFWIGWGTKSGDRQSPAANSCA